MHIRTRFITPPVMTCMLSTGNGFLCLRTGRMSHSARLCLALTGLSGWCFRLRIPFTAAARCICHTR